MNVYKRAMMFVSLIGSCLSLALLAGALGTKYWIVATAKRLPNPTESHGDIHFGLFQGEKNLNVAYGWRTYHISVLEILRSDSEYMIYSLWLGTVASMVIALVLAVVTSVLALINTATTPIRALAGVPGLYLCNFLTMMFQSLAVSLWAFQYYKKLQYNVMNLEDKLNLWNSNGKANFGFSFWFVIGGVIIHLVNICFIYAGTSTSRPKSTGSVIEEKGNGAIMLY